MCEYMPTPAEIAEQKKLMKAEQLEYMRSLKFMNHGCVPTYSPRVAKTGLTASRKGPRAHD